MKSNAISYNSDKIISNTVIVASIEKSNEI